MTNFSATILRGPGLHLTGPDYIPETDTVSFAVHGEGGGHLVRVLLAGPSEQRRFLDLLAPVMHELQRRLAIAEGAERFVG